MSYCRFSCMDFKCELYIYASYEGYTCHISTRRLMEDLPEVPNFMELDTKDPVQWQAWVDANAARSKALETARFDPIQDEHAGQTYSFDTAAEMAEFMVKLRGLGYIFPDWALEAMYEEAALENDEDSVPVSAPNAL